MITCFSTGSGWYCGCFSTSTSRRPRLSWLSVALSRSLPNCANAASSRILREVEAQRAGHLAHRLDLRRAADARDRVADVDRRTDALVEQVALEEDLPVGDRDDVGRDVGREVARLRLDDRQRRQRSAAVLLPSASRRARAGASAGRRRRPDTPRGPAGGAAAARSRGTPARASRGRRRCTARGGRCRGSTRPSCTPSTG